MNFLSIENDVEPVWRSESTKLKLFGRIMCKCAFKLRIRPNDFKKCLKNKKQCIIQKKKNFKKKLHLQTICCIKKIMYTKRTPKKPCSLHLNPGSSNKLLNIAINLNGSG